MRTTSRAASSFFLAALVIALPLFADHPVDWLESRRNPETTLAGIALGKPVKRAISRYGQPTSVHRDEKNGISTYRWNKGDFQIEVSTDREIDPRVETVDQIRITGDRSIPAGKTGAGVRLGDRLEQLVAKYGYRYRTEDRQKGSHLELNVVFAFSNETELAAEFSDDGEIISLQLTASSE